MMHVSTVSPVLRGSLRDRILRALRRYWPLYLMAIPGMLYFIIYKIVPIFGAVIAFKNFTIKKGIWGSPWAQPWYQHYKYFFRSPSNVRIITNTINTTGGMVCDGAKSSCASKIATAVGMALLAMDMSEKGRVFKPGEGLVEDNVEETIESVGRMGREGMKSTDVEILKIMLGK